MVYGNFTWRNTWCSMQYHVMHDVTVIRLVGRTSLAATGLPREYWCLKKMSKKHLFFRSISTSAVNSNKTNTERSIYFMLDMPLVLWRCWFSGRKGSWPVKNWVVGCWRGCLSGARARLAYGPADATVLNGSCISKIPLVLPFWYRLTRVVADKGPLNGCVGVCICRQH